MCSWISIKKSLNKCKEDPRSYLRNLCSCEKKAWKNQACRIISYIHNFLKKVYYPDSVGPPTPVQKNWTNINFLEGRKNWFASSNKIKGSWKSQWLFLKETPCILQMAEIATCLTPCFLIVFLISFNLGNMECTKHVWRNVLYYSL